METGKEASSCRCFIPLMSYSVLWICWNLIFHVPRQLCISNARSSGHVQQTPWHLQCSSKFAQMPHTQTPPPPPPPCRYFEIIKAIKVASWCMKRSFPVTLHWSGFWLHRKKLLFFAIFFFTLYDPHPLNYIAPPYTSLTMSPTHCTLWPLYLFLFSDSWSGVNCLYRQPGFTCFRSEPRVGGENVTFPFCGYVCAVV